MLGKTKRFSSLIEIKIFVHSSSDSMMLSLQTKNSHEMSFQFIISNKILTQLDT